MWGKKPERFGECYIPAPRLPRREPGMETVLSFVERATGAKLSLIDAEVLVTLIKTLKREETEQDDSEEQRAAMSVLRERDDSGNAEPAIPAGHSAPVSAPVPVPAVSGCRAERNDG